MVAHVAVITELERLAAHVQRDIEAQEHLSQQQASVAAAATQATAQDRRAQAALAIRRRRLDERAERGQTSGTGFARAALQHHQALVLAEQTATAAHAAQTLCEQNQVRLDKLEQQLIQQAARQQHLAAQRTIRQLDVAQDMILTATKLTALQLIAFVLRVYFTSLPMTAETFISRVFSLRGRKELTPQTELIVFYRNPRDPKVSQSLEQVCRVLNGRHLQRDGRQLRYEVEAAPSSSQFD